MITVKTYKSNEVQSYKETKYREFIKYFFETTIGTTEIYKAIGVNDTNSTARYIRRKCKKEGLDALSRHHKIMKGEWL